MKATKQDKLLITPLRVSVHRKGDNPFNGERAIIVTVDCSGGGPFIVLDTNEGKKDCLLFVHMDELEAVTAAARKLIAGVKNTGKEQQ